VLVGFAAGVYAEDPVTVAVAVTGTPSPGATVTAKATVTINNGSVLQGIQWEQVGGLPATLSGASTANLTIGMPSRATFRNKLIEVLEEPPVEVGGLPENVPAPDPYWGGLQNRFQVVGPQPLALEHAGALEFEITVVTSSGTYHFDEEIAATLPWPHATGIRNVPIGVPVILHGKEQATYDWSMTRPAGSAATLMDPTSQNPEFTPDVAGEYVVTVNELSESGMPSTSAVVTIDIEAGTWKGIIVGQDANGRPNTDPECMVCHKLNTPNFDEFTPWRQTGHAEIFTVNVNTSTHYSTSCFSCHTVGYDPNVDNGGIDDAPGYAEALASGLMTHADADNWTNLLDLYPEVAKRGNIQCENCHGPQNSDAHYKRDGSRVSLNSDMCGSCHGEPARHGRFQQWQLSGHANFETARGEGTNPSCARCHSGQGFVQWAKNGFNDDPINVTWTEDDVEPQTCAMCHDPHAIGTTSGNPGSNATVRLMGDTPVLDAGFKATDVGRGAICMLCHNSRRGLRNDDTFSLSDISRASHVGPQADILMGQNLYFVKTGQRGYHSMIEDTCVSCHMEKTPPPADLSYNLGGTNHTFFASKEICSKCHTEIKAEDVQHEVEGLLEDLKVEIEQAILTGMQLQIRAGNAMNIGGTVVTAPDDIAAVELTESHGRQAIATTLRNGTMIAATSLNSVKVVRPTGSSVEIYAVLDPTVAKAGWNYFMVHSDMSEGVHNPVFVESALRVAKFAVQTVNTAANNPAIGGGPANNAGAVSCTTPYVYWAELVGHLNGLGGSVWRTDIIGRNLSSSDASLRFVLHMANGNMEGVGTIDAGSQKAFEDIVGMLGGTANKGALEICSNRPLLVLGRTYNQSVSGSFGQFIDGHVANLGLSAGDTVNLLGMRQLTGLYRTNLSVTNGGTTDAEVAITLYDSDGLALTNYNLTVPAGLVVQDGEPFLNRANAPDVDWGFATVTVLSGTNIRTSAALIDMKTNDPTTIPAKQ